MRFPTTPLHAGARDILFCLMIVIFAYFVQQGRIGSSINGIDLSTDAAQYCAMASALGHPEAFARDDAYADPEAVGVHATFIVPIIARLAENANYGLAYLRLTGLHVAAHAIAFYILGVVLFRRRLYGVAFALLMQQAYWIPWGTYFGAGYLDYTPRTTFELFYPFYLCAALAILHRPRWWPPFMMLFGLMVYVHSISTLPVAIGFLLGFLLHRPQGVSRLRHCAWVCLSGLCFIVVIAPFVLKFLRHNVVLTPEDVAVLHQTLITRYDIEFSQYWQAIGNFILYFVRIPLLPLTLVAAWLLHRFGDAREKELLGQFGMWTLGVLIVAALFVVDQEAARALGRHHYEFDFIRVLRFMVFFAFCLLLLCTTMLLRLSKGTGSHAAAVVLSIAVCVGIGLGGDPALIRQSLMWYWNKQDPDRYMAAYGSLLHRAAMIEALRQHTEPGSTIFYASEAQAIRHNAQRALVYGWKDASIFYYAKNAQKLRQWIKTQQALTASPTAYIDIARHSAADYILTNRPQDMPELEKFATPVWQGDGYALLKMQKK